MRWLETLTDPRSLWLLFVLYAETHYRIRFLPNRLFKREPEILFDAPGRIEPGQTLPVMLLIKDAHRFPVRLRDLSIKVLKSGEEIALHTEKFDQCIDAPFWHTVLKLSLPEGTAGELTVVPRLTVEVNGHLAIISTDNYRRTRHAPLLVEADTSPLPGHRWYDYGELHYHSHLTNDQVEFGAPIPAAVQLAEAQGHSFLAITDHSYDLDDRLDDYLRNDLHRPKWRELQALAEQLNSQHNSFVVIPGEELSVGNHKNHNVHLLILNNDDFLEGSGDSAEKWLQNKPQFSIPEVLAQLQEKALAFSAHPLLRPSAIERWIFNRDCWHLQDLNQPRLNGLQAWNGLNDAFLEKGLRAWRSALLAGRKSVLVAGNDAHGNFNRSRQILIPFWSMREKRDRRFGLVRTGIPRCRDKIHLDGLVQSLKNGAVIASSGPAADLHLFDRNGGRYGLGETCRGPGASILIEAESSPLFGTLEGIHLFFGDLLSKKEIQKTLPVRSLDFFATHHLCDDLPWPERGYVRAEVVSKKSAQRFRCYTNPIYCVNE